MCKASAVPAIQALTNSLDGKTRAGRAKVDLERLSNLNDMATMQQKLTQRKCNSQTATASEIVWKLT